MRWFRFHAETLENPKIQRLSTADFKLWVNLLCLAASEHGFLPSVEVLAFRLRTRQSKVDAALVYFMDVGLIDKIEDRYMMHDWNAWQYKSDFSTERVKQHRERKRNVSPNVPSNGSSSVSVSVSENLDLSKKEKKENGDGFDLRARFDAVVKRHPDPDTHPDRTWPAYTNKVVCAVDSHAYADLFDSRQRSWIEYWSVTGRKPMGLLNYILDGCCELEAPKPVPKKSRLEEQMDRI